ncbi:MAG: HPr(Ser) kinase/phosphatase [Candidatus Cloacimonetes bacterium 4572_65]|nr:MAG: HPr(Ser) kinase/phosphatase [Candidatus Cloacimonetes bacterium 4572_65]
MKEITLKTFFEKNKNRFALSVITETKTLDNTIKSPHINRPGLALAGFLNRFSADRIQILGETEVRFLQSMSEDILYARIKNMFTYNIPCIIVTKGLSLPFTVIYLANEMNIAIFSSRLSTVNLYHSISKYFESFFAQDITIHATLVDIYGVGILLTGKSGIGKSECALDLVHRGHSLVSDDTVKISLLDDKLTGTPAKKDFGHFMEIRGVGFINIERMFGIQRVRKELKIDMQIELMPWRENMDYERIGLVNNFVEHLGINIPIIYLPVSPGKNVSVIVEVAAMNFILKTYGYDAAEDYTSKIKEEIKRKSLIRSRGKGNGNSF